MKRCFSRRGLGSTALIGALTALLLASPAAAQDCPAKPIKLLVALPAGGAGDIVMRALPSAGYSKFMTDALAVERVTLERVDLLKKD